MKTAVHAAILAALVTLAATNCGGRRPNLDKSGTTASANTINVHLSAGAPIPGATITVYAIHDENAQVNLSVGNSGIIGTGGPTDSSGKAAVSLSTTNYSGPIQVIASGAALSYADPTGSAPNGGSAPLVQIPSSFVLSSFISSYNAGGSLDLPVTLLTTLADHEALAYLRGLHPLHLGAKKLSEALTERDPLWVTHVTTSTNAWNPATLRSTVPASFTTSTATLVDAVYAALPDLALNQLARDTGRAAYGEGSSAVTAITLAQLLEEDLDADAVLNGKGSAGAAIVTQGTNHVLLDSQFLRKPLAQALDTWIQNAALNLSGIHQGDLVGAQVFSAMTTDASDLFGDPPAGEYNPVDRAPPVLALATEPPQYAAAAAKGIALTITADDPSGVAGVFARIGATRYPATQQADRTWKVTVDLQVAGHNVITIWAVDQSPSANSGLDGQAPYQLTRDILLDTTLPSANYDAAFASYYDERGMAVSSQVPPTYTTAAKGPVPAGGDFYKVATRLNAGAQASAAELETTNAQNIPLLRFAVPFNAQTDSPISQATYTVKVTCPGPCPAFPDATGALLVSPTKTEQEVHYLLPLATEYVPALATVQGPATLAVTITLVDGAGNSNAISAPGFTFHVLGPPLVVAEDTGYQASGDGKSTYPYRLNSPAYATLYDGGATVFNPENTVRLVRYIITNPASQAVALSTDFAGGAWSDQETWNGLVTGSGHAYYTLTPGRQPPPAGAPASWCSYIQNNTGAALPADLTTASVQYSACADSGAFFTPTGGTPQCSTDPGAVTITGPQTSAGLAVNAYYLQAGRDGGTASTTGSGRYVVPAASGTSPGVLSLYVVRPRTGLQGRIPLTGWNGANFVQDIGQEATMVAAYHHQYYSYMGPCEYWNGSWVSAPVYQDNLTHYSRTLASAADSISGALSLQTFGVNGSAEFGEGQIIPGGTLDLTRSISH